MSYAEQEIRHSYLTARAWQAVLFCLALVMPADSRGQSTARKETSRIRARKAAEDRQQGSARATQFNFVEVHMGVEFRIRLYADNSAVANKAAKAAYQRVDQLNSILSDYDSESEVRRLCERAHKQPIKVSADLFNVLKAADEVSRRTNGAFDVTLGHLTKLWRRARRRNELPPADLLAKARESVGFRQIRLNQQASTIELLRPNMRIDLGGIAKGYAVDEALKVLKRHGITSALVDGSGDIAIGAPPPHQQSWSISVIPFRSKPKEPLHLELTNCAVATSGDAFQHVMIDGKRYSHILDPKTGFGLSQSSSVTIIAPNAMLADSLASAISVMGPISGIQFINSKPQDKIEALIHAIDSVTGEVKQFRSQRFPITSHK